MKVNGVNSKGKVKAYLCCHMIHIPGVVPKKLPLLFSICESVYQGIMSILQQKAHSDGAFTHGSWPNSRRMRCCAAMSERTLRVVLPHGQVLGLGLVWPKLVN